MNFQLSTFNFQLSILLLSLALNDEVFPRGEVLLQQHAQALCRQARLGEVAVVGLGVGLQCDGAGAREQILDIEVANEVAVGHGGVAIAKVSVNEQAVIKQAALEYALDVHVVPAVLSRAQVGSKVPVRLAEHA